MAHTRQLRTQPNNVHFIALQWRHASSMASQIADNCSFNGVFRLPSMKASKLRINFCEGITGGFPTKRAVHTISMCMSWRHQWDIIVCLCRRITTCAPHRCTLGLLSVIEPRPLQTPAWERRKRHRHQTRLEILMMTYVSTELMWIIFRWFSARLQ